MGTLPLDPICLFLDTHYRLVLNALATNAVTIPA